MYNREEVHINKKNLLIVAANGLGRSGVPNVILQVIKATKNDYNIDLVVFNNDDFYKNEIENRGVNVFKMPYDEPNTKIKRLLWRLFREKKLVSNGFKELLSLKHYDIIHSFREYDSAYIFKVGFEKEISKRILHCNNEIRKPRNIVSRIICSYKRNLIRKYTTKLIGVSKKCCSISYPGIEYDVLYNTFDENKFKNILCKSTKENLVLVHLGTFSSRKNQLFSLDVISELRNFLPSKLYLIGFEAEKGYLNLIEEKIKKLNLEESVVIVDGNKDFTEIIEIASFVILPSLSEGAPLVLVEAQSAGMTCFASSNVTNEVDCGGVVYIKGFNEKEWSDKILESFKNGKYKRNKYNTDRFSFETFKRKILSIYKE